MITKNYLEPWIKKQLDEITKESNEPFNPNYESVLNYIAEHYSADETDGLMRMAFLYGKIVGDNVASDRIKWNAMAVHHNTITYIEMHNGDLPKDYNDLKEFSYNLAEYVADKSEK